jgi:hypothetical protein
MTSPALDDRARIATFRLKARIECEDWHKKIQHRRDLYNFEHWKGVRAGPNETQYSDPTYTNSVDLAVGVLLANQLDWEAFGWTPSLLEEQDTSKVEKFLAGIIAVNSERNEYQIPYETIMHFCRDGCAVLYSPWDPKLARSGRREMELVEPESPEGVTTVQAFTELPLRMQVIDPAQISVVPGGPGRWAKVFRDVQMSVFDVEQLYGVTLSKYVGLTDQEKMLLMGTLTDFWEVVAPPKGEAIPEDTPQAEAMRDFYADKTFALQNGVLFEDEFVRPLRLMPGYEDYPYTLGFFKPVDRDQPKLWGQSLIDPMESTVELLEKAINRRQRQIDVYSSLPIVSRTLPGRAVDVDPGLATHVNLSPQEDIGFPTWPGNAPDVQGQIDFYRARVQQSGFSDVMYGSGQSSGSGYALSQLGDQNRIRLTQPVEHLILLFTKWALKVMALTRNFAGEEVVQVYGKLRGQNFSDVVRGKDLEGYRVAAVIHPVFPNEEVRKHAMATQVKGVLSEHTIMERYLNVRQPNDERKRRMQEQLLQDPAMQRYVVLSALKELAESKDPIAALVMQQMAQQALPAGGQGRPADPNNPEQMSGMMSATGQPTPQEAGGEPPGQGITDQLDQAVGASPNMAGGF